LAHFRIALTAKCEHFVGCFRSFDADTKELNDARSNAEKAADKSVIDFTRIGKPKSAIMGVYNQKGPTGEHPADLHNGKSSLFANFAVVNHPQQQHRRLRASPGAAAAPGSSSSSSASSSSSSS
jgi:hypothetical protein